MSTLCYPHAPYQIVDDFGNLQLLSLESAMNRWIFWYIFDFTERTQA